MAETPKALRALQKDLELAARASGAVLMRYYRKRLNISEKKGAGLVTQADRGAERAALKILKKKHPEFAILTEETGAHAPRSKGKYRGRFILDPLDGTTNFVHGFPMFCVSLAAEWDGEICAGVIYHPVFDELYSAATGLGARLNGKRLKVSKTSKLRNSLLTTGFSHQKPKQLHLEMDAFERLGGIARAVRRPGSAALDMAYTAQGVFDGFWEGQLSPWDVAAGIVIVEEAGGRVTDFNNKRLKLGHGIQSQSSVEILASNRKLHDSLRRAIRPPFCPI